MSEASKQPIRRAKRKAAIPHGCFDSANEQLRKKNTKLVFAMQIPSGEERLVIATEKVARGPKPVLLLANFCPFCGRHLP